MPIADIVRRATPIVLGLVTTLVGTSTDTVAVGSFENRKVDRCQNGVLWAHWWNGTVNTTSSMRFAYSLDGGIIWNNPAAGSFFGFAGTGLANLWLPQSSFFIDLDDFAHIVYVDRHSGSVLYRRGVPNATRTGWTWSSPTELAGFDARFSAPDLVAHRHGTAWVVHVVYSILSAAPTHSYYRRITLNSNGTINSITAQTSIASTSMGFSILRPSIDFHHVGDGKTVSGGTPHLYVAWADGSDSSTPGVRFRRATFSGSSWSWSTIRTIDSAARALSNTWINCLFDGTAVIIGGRLVNSSNVVIGRLWERNAGDTITTSLSTNLALMDLFGSLTYDGSRNVYVFGQVSSKFVLKKWERATNTITSEDIDTSDTPSIVIGTLKRGHSEGRIEFIYLKGSASPYSINVGGTDQ